MSGDMMVVIQSLITTTLRMSIPVILASLAGVFSARAGIVAMGLEGMMCLFGSICDVYYRKPISWNTGWNTGGCRAISCSRSFSYKIPLGSGHWRNRSESVCYRTYNRFYAACVGEQRKIRNVEYNSIH